MLRLLKMDTRTLLERYHASVDGTDCADVQDTPNTRKTIVVGRLTKTTPQPRAQRPYVDNLEAHKPDDEFPDPNIRDVVDNKTERAAVREALQDRIKEADGNELPKNHSKRLKTLLDDNTKLFSKTVSHGLPAKVKPLKIDLTADSKPVRVKLRNYFQDQRRFLKTFVDKLISWTWCMWTRRHH